MQEEMPSVLLSDKQEKAPPDAKKMDKEDRMELENLQLKLNNIRLQMQIMQADLQKAVTTRNGIVDEMKAARERCQQKYGVDIARIKLLPDGTIIPLDQSKQGS